MPESTVRYFISSLETHQISPPRFAATVRGHWNIENGTHWRRDVLWGEDKHRLKYHGAAHILSTLRQVALCLHSSAQHGSSASISSALQRVHHHKASGISLLNRPPP